MSTKKCAVIVKCANGAGTSTIMSNLKLGNDYEIENTENEDIWH